MSNEKIRLAAAFGQRMREQKCTTEGHSVRQGRWLIARDDQRDGMRWVCDECREASRGEPGEEEGGSLTP